jgi:hypothetical protein
MHGLYRENVAPAQCASDSYEILWLSFNHWLVFHFAIIRGSRKNAANPEGSKQYQSEIALSVNANSLQSSKKLIFMNDPHPPKEWSGL